MKGHNQTPKRENVGSFLKKAQDKQNAFNQVVTHNQREGTTKIKFSDLKTHQQGATGAHSMELNALDLIRQTNNVQHSGIYPNWQQISNAEEKEIIQKAGNLDCRKSSLALHIKLIELKEKNIERYNDEFLNHPNRLKMAGYYQQNISKESGEIEWLRKMQFNDFFNSEYVRGFGLVFQYNPPANQGQNQPLPLPQPPENPEEEAMIQELRAQLAQMRQEMEEQGRENTRVNEENIRVNEENIRVNEENTRVTEERDNALNLVADRDRVIEEQNTALADKDQIIADKDQALAYKDTIIEDLNNTIHDLQQAQGNDPRVLDLTHQLEIVTIQKEAAERTVIDREREITGLREDKHSLQQDKNDLRERNNELKDEKAALKHLKEQLEENVNNLSTKVEVKQDFIEQVKGYYEEYEVLLSGCGNCSQQYAHHDLDWTA